MVNSNTQVESIATVVIRKQQLTLESTTKSPYKKVAQ